MNIEQQGENLEISGINALDAAHSQAFKAVLCRSLPARIKSINLDLSQTRHIDCRGVGALVSLQNCVARKNGKVAIRVFNPTGPVRHLLKLTHLDGVFRIQHR